MAPIVSLIAPEKMIAYCGLQSQYQTNVSQSTINTSSLFLKYVYNTEEYLFPVCHRDYLSISQDLRDQEYIVWNPVKFEI